MKSPAFRLLAGLLLCWTLADISYRVLLHRAASAHTVATAAPLPLQPDDYEEMRVLVRRDGAYYHNARCKVITGAHYVRLSTALSQRYRPCPKCGG